MKKRKIKEYAVSYSFLLPFVLFFIVFTIIPIGYVVYLSFHDGNFLQASFEWVGLKNFKDVILSPDFQRAFKNTFIYMLIEVPVSQFLGILFALLIKKKTRFSHFCEMVYFLPMLISMVVASVLISYIISNNGPLNLLLQSIGLKPISWLNGGFTAKMAVMILELWKGGTFFIFVYMSAMRSLPADCLESAKIDGANIVQETIYVVLPLIRNAVILCVTMNTIWQFQIFESVYMLTNGGPLGATQTVIYEIYQFSFKYYRVGFGAAASLVFLAVILCIYGVENLLLRERGTEKRRKLV
ncbi:MAG: carbohydrate ABC transporter permease [Marvinbryantia sp.]|jgi:multiple sugar transport system permease protein